MSTEALVARALLVSDHAIDREHLEQRDELEVGAGALIVIGDDRQRALPRDQFEVRHDFFRRGRATRRAIRDQ
jgi:hypothetical protein